MLSQFDKNRVAGRRSRLRSSLRAKAPRQRAGGPRSGPAADDDARAWNPRMACQGCRPCTHTSLDEGALVSAHLRPRASKQQSWVTARFLGVNGILIRAARTTTPASHRNPSLLNNFSNQNPRQQGVLCVQGKECLTSGADCSPIARDCSRLVICIVQEHGSACVPLRMLGGVSFASAWPAASCAGPTGASHAPERLSALRPPSIRVGEAKLQTLGADMRRGNEMGCLKSE